MAVERGFKIASAYVEITADYDNFRRSVETELPGKVGPAADKAGQETGKRFGEGVRKKAVPASEETGKESGGKLARGMHQSIVRNSPLIAAAIAGGLAAGAPLMLASAAVLFGGIGALAAAQTDSVRSAWIGTWDSIVAGTEEAGRALVPTFERLAARVANAFEDLQPRLRMVFADVAPLVDIFAEGVINAGENALPGMFRAVARGEPVMRGFSTFLELVGTGLTDFFDNMSEHSPAAGEAFAQLGQIVAELLPLLGTLLGQGAELATIVLPPFATALGAATDAADALGPLLPLLVIGFTGLKIAQNAADWVGKFGDKVKGLPGQFTGANIAAAGFGAALAMVVSSYQRATEQGENWARALREGGSAAAGARAEMETFGAAFSEVNSGFDGFLNGLTGMGGQFSATAIAVGEARDRTREMWQEMSPLEQATAKVSEWQETLNNRISEYGPNSEEARIASERLAHWSGVLADEQGELETALHGVTEAMVQQANQALAAIDSGFAYRNAVDGLEDAQVALNEAITEHGQGSEEAQRAQLALEEQTFRTAAAFAQQQADLSGLEQGTEEYQRLIQTETLAELYRLRDAAGPQMAAAIQQQINMLEASGVSLGETGVAAKAVADRMRDLGLSVQQVPGSKGVVISAPTADQKARIQDLGYTIYHLPNKQVYVTADTSQAFQALRNFLWAPALKSVPIIGTALRGGAATGGNVGEKIKGFPGGGKISGPGTRTSDSILAMSQSGPLRVSDDEWVINGAVSAMQGDRRMAALNAGRAEIVEHGSAPTGDGGRGGIKIERVEVSVRGILDFRDRRGVRQFAEEIRAEIEAIEREYR